MGNLTDSGNIALGGPSGSFITSGNSNIDIGNQGVTGDSATIRIGNAQTRTLIAGISGAPVTRTPVVVDGSGELGVSTLFQAFQGRD